MQEDVKICYKCKTAGHVARDCPLNHGSGVSPAETVDGAEHRNVDENKVETAAAAAAKEAAGVEEDGEGGRRAAGEGLRRKARAKVAEEEIAAIRAEENLVELSEEQRSRLTELDTLTGSPQAEDVLLYAVPVCGPYNALQGYKFRVKLTPGAAKKGKGEKHTRTLVT